MDFWAVLLVEGLRTSDGRVLTKDGITWRDLPVPVFAQLKNAGHPDAPVVGRIDEIKSMAWPEHPDFNLIVGKGNLNDSVEALAAIASVEHGSITTGSADVERFESALIVDGKEDNVKALWDGEDLDVYERIDSGRIAGWTICPIAAFPQAKINLESEEALLASLPAPMHVNHLPDAEALVAGGEVNMHEIPAEWFSAPSLDGPTKLIVEDSGRLYGHLALWGTDHIGISNRRVNPPRSRLAYAPFHSGRVKAVADDGSEVHVDVGQITLDTGHAKPNDSWANAVAHYDHTGTAVADVTCGEDEHGIWFAGALRDGVTSEQIHVLQASGLSGDWRRIKGNLELVAVLSVNVPGFPLVASGVIDDEQVSLVAATMPPESETDRIAREVIRRADKALGSVAKLSLQKRVNGPAIEQLRQRVNAG